MYGTQISRSENAESQNKSPVAGPRCSATNWLLTGSWLRVEYATEEKALRSGMKEVSGPRPSAPPSRRYHGTLRGLTDIRIRAE
jgi:hypothetical protein